MLFAHSPLPPVGVFCLGLLTWDRLCAHVVMGFHSSWTFISKYFWIFHKYLQWAFGQLVIMFETIGQVSNTFVNNIYFDEFHVAIMFMVSNNHIIT